MPKKSRRASRAKSPNKVQVTLGSKARYAIPEASVLLGISERLLYQRIAEGALTTVTDGRRRFMTDAEIRRYGESSR
jgi:hypothetical protein